MATHPTPLEPEDVLDLPLPAGVSGYELVDGQPVPVTPASWQHGQLILHVGHLLKQHIETHGLDGEVAADAGFVLRLARDPRRLRGPDVAYISGSRLREFGDSSPRFARFTPDLAIEIDLTSGRKPDAYQRIRDYLEAGVPLVWVIDPRRRVAIIYRKNGSSAELHEHDSLDGEEILPGFRLPLKALFK